MNNEQFRQPETTAGQKMWELAQKVKTQIQPEDGGPVVDVAVFALEAIRLSILEIEDEALND
jgi:hypothetical protein